MKKPDHIAVIMDGNGRWAKQKILPRIAGYTKGVDAVRGIIKMCIEKQIEFLSLFAFSSENWNRPKAEVTFLMDLFLKLLKEEVINLNKNNVKLKIIGDISTLSVALQNTIAEATNLTCSNVGLKLNIAINYGGKWDLLQAFRYIIEKVQRSECKTSDINEGLISKYLSTSDVPDPDLLIRTSGEQRISNFFLWQTAYTEIFFTKTLWPDFSEVDFQQALDFYNTRKRKFGAIIDPEQTNV